MLLEYAFFRHALVGALLVSLCCGIIGTYVVTRRRVFIAGGVTHASLGGLGLGVLLGVSPTLTATLFAVATAVGVQWLSERRNVREDSAIAMTWSLGMALGIIFIFLTPGYAPSLTEYLFGNILTVTTADLWLMAAFTAVLVAFQALFRRPILYVAFDAQFARLQGLHTGLVDYAMTVLTAVAIVLSIRMVGIVLLLSVLTVPQMTAALWCHDYRRMVWLSAALCFAGCAAGLYLSFWLNVPAGACIVALMVTAYFALRGLRHLTRRVRRPSPPPAVATLCVVALCALLLSGCKSNTALNRTMKGFTTRFNTYFNGEQAYEEGLRAMERQKNDEYAERIDLHPVHALAGQKPRENANFQRAIEKSMKCVQTKSITQKPTRRRDNPSAEYKLWLTRGEFNPYLHHAWLLSGRAQFYEGDFDAAVATFNYVERHFWWKPLAQAEGHIWKARAHALQGDTYAAESELNLLVPQKAYATQAELARNETYRNLTRRLQREFSLAQAEILLAQSDGTATEADRRRTAEALPYLSAARRGFLTKDQRIRTSFLIAQLNEELADAAGSEAERTAYRRQAHQAYDKIVRQARDYKTQFNARVAQTRVMPTANLRKVERKLRRMTWQARNKEYLDQLHYALGNVAMMQADTARAIAEYEEAVEKSTRGGMDKAVAALRLGEITFEQADYVKAQKAYATAMGILKEDYKGYAEIKKLSATLDELQTHAESVQLQDSLLHLATLGEEELYAVIDNLIKELKKKEKEERDAQALADYENRKSQNVDPLAAGGADDLPTVGQQDKSWYFYNPSLVTKGKAEFQRRWGARRPEDHWRRQNKTEALLAAASAEGMEEDEVVDGGNEAGTAADSTALAAADVPTPEAQAADSLADELANDPHNREYYLAQIPRTEEEVATAHQIIEEGLYNEGVIIHEKLENLPLAIRTFEDMERRYPESVHLLDTYYAIYLMYQRMGLPDMAEVYRQKLMTVFPESAYGIAVADPNYMETLREMAAGQDSLYVETYGAYLRSASDTVHQAYYFVHDRWPLSKLMPKFLFLHALSYVQEGNVEEFRDALEQLTATYPQSDVSPLASMMVKGIHEGRHVQTGTTPRGMMWGASLRQGGDSAAVDSSIIFVDDLRARYVLLLAYPTDSLSQNDLLFEVAKFNFESYLVKDFDLEIINTGGGLSVLVINGFDGAGELNDYHDKMDASPTLYLPEGITMIDISEPNFRALLAGRTFEEYFEWVERTYGGGEPDDEEAAPAADSEPHGSEDEPQETEEDGGEPQETQEDAEPQTNAEPQAKEEE